MRTGGFAVGVDGAAGVIVTGAAGVIVTGACGRVCVWVDVGAGVGAAEIGAAVPGCLLPRGIGPLSNHVRVSRVSPHPAGLGGLRLLAADCRR